MTVDPEIDQRLLERLCGRDHLFGDRILRKLIRLEERDHHLIVRSSAVGRNEEDEIQATDGEQDEENPFLQGGHKGNDTISEIRR